MFLCAWSAQSLKGLFQPKAITAAMIKNTINNRFMSKNRGWEYRRELSIANFQLPID